MIKTYWDRETRLPPRDSIPFFVENPERFLFLQAGGVTEVPESVVISLDGLIVAGPQEQQQSMSEARIRYLPKDLYEPFTEDS